MNTANRLFTIVFIIHLDFIVDMLFLGGLLPEGVEEEAKGCEGHDGDELADERAEVHEVEGEIALEEHTEEEGDETEDVQHNDDGNACEPNQGSFL